MRCAARRQIPALIAHFNQIGVAAPYTPSTCIRTRAIPTQYVFDLGQDGLGMPDRDYYLQNDAKLKQIRAQYQAHIVEDAEPRRRPRGAARGASDIVELETELARAQWTRGREPRSSEDLQQISSSQARHARSGLRLEGLPGRLRRQPVSTDYLVISQPSYIAALQHAAAHDAAAGMEEPTSAGTC